MRARFCFRGLAARREERGAILVLSTVGVVLAVIAAALAVDLGSVAQERRRDQKVADLAALDAARDIANAQALAEQSAVRNRFPLGPGFTVTAVEGRKISGSTCEALPGSGTVCVRVQSRQRNSFLSGGHDVVATAMAGRQEHAGFTMGSSLASANLDDATNLPILNRVFGRFLAGPSGQANLVSYKGLANATVQWRELQAALGFGTLNEMLNADITMGDLLSATATALNNQGTVAAVDAATGVGNLSSITTNTSTFTLGDYLHVGQGADNKALDGDVNVLQLITAGAELANKSNLIDAGAIVNVPVDLGPLGSHTLATKLKLKVIEGPKLYVGPEHQPDGNGGWTPDPLTTSQVEMTLTPHIDVNFKSPLYSVLSLQIGESSLRLKGDMSMTYTGAGAEGILEDVRCSGPGQGITVQVTSTPITTDAQGTLSVYSEGVTSLVASNVKVNVGFDVPDAMTTPGGPFDVAFSYPNDFTPPDPDGQSTPGTPAGITFTQGNVNTSVGAAGLTEVVGLVTGTLKLDGNGSVESSIINSILQPVFNAVANRLTTPALRALGVSLGPVDVTAPAQYFTPEGCGQPGLLK